MITMRRCRRYNVSINLVETVSIIDFCVFLSIILAFLPLFSAFNSTIINSLKLFAALIFLCGVMQKDSRLFSRMLAILGFAFVYNLIFYFHVYHNYTSFLRFMNESLLCWLYIFFAMYYLKYGREETKEKFVRIVIIILFVTSITTIFMLLEYPEVARVLGNSNADLGDNISFFYQRNTAGWSHIYAMTFMLPFLIERFKSTHLIKYLLTAIVVSLCIFMAQITFAILFTLFFWVFIFYTPKNIKKVFLWLGVVFFVVLVLQNYIDDFLLKLLNLVSKSNAEVLIRRIHQLYVTFSKGQLYGDGAARVELYTNSLFTFLEHPIIGFYDNGNNGFDLLGMHSQICDTLGATGVIGFTLLICAFFLANNYVIMYLENHLLKNYVKISIFMYIVFSIVNPVWHVPGAFLSIYLLPVLVNNQSCIVKQRYHREDLDNKQKKLI